MLDCQTTKSVSFRTYLLAAVLVLEGLVSLHADDGASSIAAGGIVFKRETRIVMAKEVLKISATKIVVDYDFRNDTDNDVTTEVAFPVPPYKNDWDTVSNPHQSFSDFRVWVNDSPIRFETEAIAKFKGKDVTKILKGDNIDIASFGHIEDPREPQHDHSSRDFRHLQRTEQLRLAKSGLYDYEDGDGDARWIVYLKYHWTQTFPAHSTVHIRHEYKPVPGSDQLLDVDSLLEMKRSGKPLPKGLADYDSRLVLNAFCPEIPILQTLSNQQHQIDADAKRDHDDFSDRGWIYSVEFILTTANTWQRPIEDFTLVIERPHTGDSHQPLISFCSPGPVEKLDADHFQVHLTNFVPKAELHIGFFGLPATKTAKPKQKK
jgi:hypothetical protein